MTQPAATSWELPPLILHPFDRGLDSASAYGSIQLSLLLNGMGGQGMEKASLLRARYIEFRMVLLVGKDAMRWIEQCLDFAGRDADLAKLAIKPQSFADLLVNRTPQHVAARFESWGVLDFRRILARAIGLNAVFPEPPEYGVVSTAFLEEYYAFADSLFTCYRGLTPFTPLNPESFAFSLYTSDEYLSQVASAPDPD